MMRHTLLYISIAALFLAATACTDETETDGAQGTPLIVQATTRSGETEEYKAFPAGKQIRIYYAHNNLEQTYVFLQGIYGAPADNNKETAWISQLWKPTPGADPVKGIYVEDIKSANSDGEYYFTATSYPEPWVSDAEGLYEVAADQTGLDADFGKYDFLAARAVYPDEGWKTTGVTLHFRHLLSQLRVQLILPKGKTQDGFFPNPERAVITATLAGKHSQYTVTFNNRTKTGEIFGVSLPGNTAVKDIQMRSEGLSGPVTVNGREAYCYTFSAILPKQTLYGGNLFSFLIDGKPYSYMSPEANTVTLEQEKITTVQLTVLSGQGNQKLTLNKVTLTDWIDDHADVGDLIPQHKSNGKQ